MDQLTTTMPVGLAYLGTLPEHQRLPKRLAEMGLRATFFADPATLVTAGHLWAQTVNLGHEFGNGSLIGATEDGSLSNWSLAALEDELRSTDKLLREWGMPSVESIFLPGSEHTCADGSYRPLIERLYSVCLGATTEACWHGAGRRRFQPIALSQYSEAELGLAWKSGSIPVVLIEELDDSTELLHELLLAQLISSDGAGRAYPLQDLARLPVGEVY